MDTPKPLDNSATDSLDARPPAVVRLRTSFRRYLPYMVGYLIFVLLGIWFLTGGPTQVVVGVLAIVFFGGFGAFASVRVLRRPTLELSPSGIRLANGRGIRWEDVADVGEFRSTRRAVGIRLATPDAELTRTQRFSRSGNGGWDYVFAAGVLPASGHDVVVAIVRYGRAVTGSPSWPSADR